MPAGYSNIFLVDDQGDKLGFMNHGTPEYNTNLFVILQGENDRQWLESKYIHQEIKPLGKIQVVIPQDPEGENVLLDACIAFAPKFFESCPSLNLVKSVIPDDTHLDFNMNGLPENWDNLREEARSIFEKKIRILHFPIIDKPLDLDGKYNKISNRDE